MKAIKDFEIIDHGLCHSQYFQGCGIAFTKFDLSVTGIGNSQLEAMDDCLNQLAEMDYELASNCTLVDMCADGDKRDLVSPMLVYNEEPEFYYHVSIRVKE